jgi:iron(III) transport system ATP-binding protein
MIESEILSVEQISKTFSGNSIPVVNQVGFTLKQGELLGLLGPSGCGKTTLLRILAGFEKPDQGKIYLAGKLVNDQGLIIPPEKRNTGMVFQDYALFPHLTIAENIGFGLETKQPRFSRQEIKARISEVLSLVGLTGLEKRFPHELSGGQQQRIALARALAPKPSLILLDEPLSNLDVKVRQRLRHEIRRILKQSGISGIFVTHDQEEALAISDKIAVMQNGYLEQIGTPEDIYIQPASRFVAEFVTHANFLPAFRQGNYWKTEIGEFKIPVVDLSRGVNSGELMLREEEIMLHPDDNALVEVSDRQFLGREYRYCLKTASGKRLHARTAIHTQLSIGTKVQLSIVSPQPQIFPM